jgi:hypothetical protein
MKRQYLGDSKDSFKWDYLDYLTAGLDYALLNIVLMLTPDDNSKQGKTSPELFSSRQEVIDFCRVLKKQRDFQLIKTLPKLTASKYLVELHKEETYFTSKGRQVYMTDFSPEKRQVLFLDPDNGFEPEKSRNEKHILYSDVETIIKQISEESVISVFQHFRFVSFKKDFARIRERLQSDYTTALYWHSLMFVTISKTKEIIQKVSELNNRYSQKYPVKILQ